MKKITNYNKSSNNFKQLEYPRLFKSSQQIIANFLFSIIQTPYFFFWVPVFSSIFQLLRRCSLLSMLIDLSLVFFFFLFQSVRQSPSDEILPTILAEPKWRFRMFFVCNLGIWLGFSVMFILVIFEEHIKIWAKYRISHFKKLFI
jgi:hypothetical protein